MGKPILVMLAGPNGAGKSTFYSAYLSHLDVPFLNADALAEKIGISAYEAAREIVSLRNLLFEQKQSFITETVLSDPVGAKVKFLSSAAEAGYDAQLIFVGIDGAGMSQRRVADRAAAGGHDVPLDKIIARYPRTLENLKRAIENIPLVTIYDNSSYKIPHRFIAEFRNGKLKRRGCGKIPQWANELIV